MTSTDTMRIGILGSGLMVAFGFRLQDECILLSGRFRDDGSGRTDYREL